MVERLVSFGGGGAFIDGRGELATVGVLMRSKMGIRR